MQQLGSKLGSTEFVRSRQCVARHDVFSDSRKTPNAKRRLVRPPARSRNPRKLTPIPLVNRQTKQITRPGVPSMYVFAIPNNAIDGGINHIAPTSAALRRSSVTHFPARFLRHFLIMRSETRPAIGALTFRMDGDTICRYGSRMRMREQRGRLGEQG